MIALSKTLYFNQRPKVEHRKEAIKDNYVFLCPYVYGFDYNCAFKPIKGLTNCDKCFKNTLENIKACNKKTNRR